MSWGVFLTSKLLFSVLALIHGDNPLLGFLAYSGVEAMLAVELGRGEFLLAFHTLAIYVDSQGRKSRETEIMYPAIPIAISTIILSKLS